MPYTPATEGGPAFNCPSCGAFAKQDWGDVYIQNVGKPKGWTGGVCTHCRQPSFWHCQVMIYPSGGAAPLPNADLPSDIQDDYEEARAILNRSPRGAAALLRLCIQK